MTEDDVREVEVASPPWMAIADWEIANWENEGGAILPVAGMSPATGLATGKRARSLSGMNIPPKRPARPADKGR